MSRTGSFVFAVNRRKNSGICSTRLGFADFRSGITKMADIIMLDTLSGTRADLSVKEEGSPIYLPVSSYLPFDETNCALIKEQPDHDYVVGVGYWKPTDPNRIDDVQIFVTGSKEGMENAEQTARREVGEETGIDLNSLTYVPPPLHSFTSKGKHWTNLLYRVGPESRLLPKREAPRHRTRKNSHQGVGVIIYGSLDHLLAMYNRFAGILPVDGDRIRYIVFIRISLLKKLTEQVRYRSDDMARSHLKLNLAQVNGKPVKDFDGAVLGYYWQKGFIIPPKFQNRQRRQPICF